MATAEDAERALRQAEEARTRFDAEALVAHLSAAIRCFTAADDRRRAAMACAQLGEAYENVLGNLTAARAWFTRATRLIEAEPPCVEQGWIAIAALGCDVDDPAALLAAAELALDRARRFGDVNLETKALADSGLAHVQVGRTEQGMKLLDEAMALACGPADDHGTASKSVCSFFTACYYAADFARASAWTVESDESGSMNMWLKAAPHSQVAYNALGCDVSLNDLCDRPPRAMADGEVLDLGGKRVRLIATPHVPHGWEAQVLYEETTGTLLCGDLFTQLGASPPLTDGDVVGPALAAERMFHSTSLSPNTQRVLLALAELAPRTLAIMHGSSFQGDGRRALVELADGYRQLAAESSAAA